MPIRTGRLADPGAQEASIIVQPHLAAGKKISDRCHRLPTTVRAGTDREDKIPKGEPGARLEDLPMSFHIVSVPRAVPVPSPIANISSINPMQLFTPCAL